MKIPVYSVKGIKSGELSLPKEVGTEVNMSLLAQAIRVYSDRAHVGLSKTKTRAEVNKTKKKLYRQKGTGGARHGSKRAPIFVGGGVAHGPRPLKRELALPSVMRKKALFIALSLKGKDGLVAGVSGVEKLVKTKDAKNLTEKILKDLKNVKRLTFALSESSRGAKNALRNLKSIRVLNYKDLNAYHVYFGGGLVIDKAVFEKETKAKTLPEKAKK